MPILKTLAKSLKPFSTTVWFRILYLLSLGGLMFLLFPLTFAGSTACLVILLMPVTMFVIPYWVGERKSRRFIVNGLIIFLIAVLAISTAQTLLILNSTPVELQSFQIAGLDPTMNLTNGTVRPFHASAPTTYLFRVHLTTTTSGNPQDFSVYANLTILDLFGGPPRDFRMNPEPSSDTMNGTWYNTTQSLGTSIYGFSFFVQRQGGNWTATNASLGPIAASGVAYFGLYGYYTAVYLLFPLTFYFLILFMWWYSARMRSSRLRMAQEVKEEKKGAKPPAIDKAGKAAAFTCTNCGADVDETAEKCPKCGAVFED